MAHVFKEGKMASNHLDTYLANILVGEEGIYDGAFVKLGELADDQTYVENGVEYDTYEYTEDVATADAVVDYAGVEYQNTYKLGVKLYNLKAPAGEIVRVRRLALHDKFWLGEDNIALESGATSFDTANYTIKILVTKDLTAGMHSEGKIYLCEVCEKE